MTGLDLDLSKSTRLVALISPETIQETHLAATIWRQASTYSADVLYLSIASDDQHEMDLRCRLATLAAITRDRRVRVETRVFHTSSWLTAINSILRPGDTLVVPSEQLVPKGWFGTQPLAGYLIQRTPGPGVDPLGLLGQQAGDQSRPPALVGRHDPPDAHHCRILRARYPAHQPADRFCSASHPGDRAVL